MKKIMMMLLALVVTLAAAGQEVGTSGLDKGFYVKFEFGTSCNFDRAAQRKYDQDYVERKEISDLSQYQIKKEKTLHNSAWAKHAGIDVEAELMLGYRFCPQFVLAGGTGGIVSVNSQVETFSLPLFLHLRSDFIDADVTPYAELNLGYAFMFDNAPGSEEQAGVSYEFEYGHGSERAANLIDYDILRDGLFGELSLGVSFPVGVSRMDIGVGCNISECFRGVILGSRNGYVRYGYAENISPVANYTMKEEDYVLSDYYTYGVFSTGKMTTEPFARRFHSGLHLKVGFSF